MGRAKGAVVGMLVIFGTLIGFNLILYGVLPPAQPFPETTHAQRARTEADSAGTLAGFYDFDGAPESDGWLPVEVDGLDGATFQYNAQTEAFVRIEVTCAGPWLVEYAVMDALIHPSTPVVTLSVNGQPVEASMREGFRRQIYSAPVADLPTGAWVLGFGADLERPTERIATIDERLLGAPLDWVLVTAPQGCD